MTNQIQQAIEDSIRGNEIVILRARADTSEFVSLANGLSEACDDYTRITAGDNRLDGDVEEVREYWGADEDGDDWRIHLYVTR